MAEPETPKKEGAGTEGDDGQVNGDVKAEAKVVVEAGYIQGLEENHPAGIHPPPDDAQKHQQPERKNG